MQVRFIDANGETVTELEVAGEVHEDVCDNAWELIDSGAIEAEDFQVLDG